MSEAIWAAGPAGSGRGASAAAGAKAGERPSSGKPRGLAAAKAGPEDGGRRRARAAARRLRASLRRASQATGSSSFAMEGSLRSPRLSAGLRFSPIPLRPSRSSGSGPGPPSGNLRCRRYPCAARLTFSCRGCLPRRRHRQLCAHARVAGLQRLRAASCAARRRSRGAGIAQERSEDVKQSRRASPAYAVLIAPLSPARAQHGQRPSAPPRAGALAPTRGRSPPVPSPSGSYSRSAAASSAGRGIDSHPLS
jgi:hypothetical protein